MRIESRLILLIGPPRSGTTLLMRMLQAHSQVYSRPEPHLFGPLAHLGYYDTVEKAPFDQFQAADAVRALVTDLPHGEQDYLDACRAYVDVLYSRLLDGKGGGRRYFVDKTPANALVLPFLTKLFPRAHYIVLTRHPAAVFSSYASSFFDGDYEAARRFNPILNRYIPPMAALLRERPVPLEHVRYEQLVMQPENEMRRLCRFLSLEFEPAMVEYGTQQLEGQGLGDPLTVNRQQRPVTDSIERWAPELARSSEKLALVREMLDAIDDRDLEAWGTPRPTLWQPLQAAGAAGEDNRIRWNRFLLQRKLLVWLRRDIHQRSHGRWIKRIRDACDILLRG
ncbi:MAG TPA: sulfotransferase [Terriglobales bacterium]|nr:sulfotransferase [Terriglobales bacterium]